MHLKRIVVLSALMFGAGPALAQTTSPGDTVSATNEYNVTEVTVVGHLPGPALWRVRKGDAEVYIVGALPVLQKRFDWDRSRVSRILDKSNVLLTPPQAKVGVLGLVKWQFAKGNGLFRDLYSVMPWDLSNRFRKVAKQNGLDPKDYAKDNPILAVMRLRDDVYLKHNLATNNPEKMLEFMAKQKGKPMRSVADYSAARLVGKVSDMSDAARNACVTATLNEIDFAVAHGAAATQAWANADLKTARDNSPSSATLACLEGSGSTRDVLDRATDDTVKAIDDALSKPGVAVISLPMSVLLRQNGVLDQLKAQGADVSEPES